MKIDRRLFNIEDVQTPVCKYCGREDGELLKLPRALFAPTEWAHTACLVAQTEESKEGEST